MSNRKSYYVKLLFLLEVKRFDKIFHKIRVSIVYLFKTYGFDADCSCKRCKKPFILSTQKAFKKHPDKCLLRKTNIYKIK